MTSPSGSTSFDRTGRIVDRPGRTPYESSLATGGRFFSDRFLMGLSTCSGLSFLASVSEPFLFSGIFCSQSSTFWNRSAASHTVPDARSLRTTFDRFTRYRSVADESRPAKRWSRSRAVPSQSRTTWPVPDHAPYVQPATCTGAAGRPDADRVVALEPSSGWETRPDVVA